MQNSGDCPRLTWHHRCSFPIVHECAVDVDCGETKNKCCYNGCKLTCQTAVKRKHGKRHRGYTSKGRKGGGEGVVGESSEEHVIFRRIEGGLVIVDKVYIRRGRRGLYKFNR